MTNAKTVLEFGIRTLFDRRGNPMGRWCIHCNAYVTPDLDKSHVSYCPYAALAASEARVKALEYMLREVWGWYGHLEPRPARPFIEQVEAALATGEVKP